MQDASDRIRLYFHHLAELIESFNFKRQGRDKSMGRDAAQLVAEGIVSRSAQDQGGPDEKWPPNTDDYTTSKLNWYGVELVGFRTGQMISMPSLLGRVDVSTDTVEIYYGTFRPPDRTMTGAPLKPSDLRVNDVQKAGYFTDLKGAFFVLDTTIAEKVRGYFVDELRFFLASLNSL